MILETKRLILRPWSEDDKDDLFEYGFNDGHDYIDYLMDKADQEW